MSAERFFDDLARTLAEPMPRRRAVRVIGASLAALAVPGVSPRIARAAMGGGYDIGPSSCPGGASLCSTYIDPSNWPKGQKHKCCPYPNDQWTCGGPDAYTCIDTCKATLAVLPKGKGVKATWSQATWPDGSPKRYNCCVLPDTKAVDGECLPNCPYQYRFGGAIGPVSCGETCCATYQICVKGECQPCEKFGGHSCQPAGGGAAVCCPRGTNCCANNKTTACCGPKQTCHAAGVKQATCKCDTGKKCGSDCCDDGETCCQGKECCAKGETCTGNGCCPKDRVCPTGEKANTCCDGKDEYCLFKADPDLVPLGGTKPRDLGTCKKGCAPGNRAGKQCCGTGYKPNRAKTGCVRA